MKKLIIIATLLIYSNVYAQFVPRAFNTITNLIPSNTPQSLNKFVVVLGMNSVNDGNGGGFVWIAGDSTATNTYSVFASTYAGANGRYIRMPSSFVYPVACSDETTALTNGTAKVTFRAPFAFTLTSVRASLTTAQSSGSIFTVDLNESGTSVLSTKITIDNGEKTTESAATPSVVSDSIIANDAELTVDIDQVGDGTAKGLKIEIYGYQ